MIIEFKPKGKAAVLLNGTTPGYFVGHVDEFNHDWWWHQNLLLPPGTHHITVTQKGKTVWSGDVTVVADKKIVIHKNGMQKTKDWPRGEKLKDVPRFKAGIASATVAVAPVTGSFSFSPGTSIADRPQPDMAERRYGGCEHQRNRRSSAKRKPDRYAARHHDLRLLGAGPGGTPRAPAR